MTEKLYYMDSHMFEFEAKVLECREENGAYAVILDRTAFFPEGGGQRSDTGSIADTSVTDVQEKNGEILHYCTAALQPGSRVKCALDKEQRLRRMQSHSGEHIVSGISHNLYGCENVGFHMGDDVMVIDFDRELSRDELMRVETLANEAVRENLAVKAWFPDGQELSRLEYRSKLELTENVRIVEIPGVDRCACCAPHVKCTGEIGEIKILDAERHRGGIRISLVCGMNALDDHRQRQECVTQISRLLSAKRDNVSAAVERLLEEEQKMKERIAALSMELVSLRAAGCAETDGNICLFDTVLDEVAQRELVNLLMDKCGALAAVFCGSDADGYRYIIGSKSIDLRKNGKAVNAAINGRGGGSTQMIQGRATAAREEIEKKIITLSL